MEDLLRPGGRLIRRPGSRKPIRIMSGGIEAARDLFDKLLEVGEVEERPTHPGIFARIPGVGTIGLRPMSRSGYPTIDVTISGIGIDEMKFEE